MEAIIDAHALFWFVTQNPKLSQKARGLIMNADSIVIPAIVLMEILYIFKKNKVASEFPDFLSKIDSTKYLLYPLDIQVVLKSLSLAERLEMHDAIIAATAFVRDAFLISRDLEIRKYYPKTVW